MIPTAADLLDKEKLNTTLSEVSLIHVFIPSWLRNETEAENIRVNSLRVRNLLTAVAEKRTVQHVTLVTGLKYYLEPFGTYAKKEHYP